MSAAERAKHLLTHYLQLALTRAGCKTDRDMTVEMESIVDEIVQASVEATLERLRKERN